jgi:hypothetical protein
LTLIWTSLWDEVFVPASGRGKYYLETPFSESGREGTNNLFLKVKSWKVCDNQKL